MLSFHLQLETRLSAYRMLVCLLSLWQFNSHFLDDFLYPSSFINVRERYQAVREMGGALGRG